MTAQKAEVVHVHLHVICIHTNTNSVLWWITQNNTHDTHMGIHTISQGGIYFHGGCGRPTLGIYDILLKGQRSCPCYEESTSTLLLLHLCHVPPPLSPINQHHAIRCFINAMSSYNCQTCKTNDQAQGSILPCLVCVKGVTLIVMQFSTKCQWKIRRHTESTTLSE